MTGAGFAARRGMEIKKWAAADFYFYQVCCCALLVAVVVEVEVAIHHRRRKISVPAPAEPMAQVCNWFVIKTDSYQQFAFKPRDQEILNGTTVDPSTPTRSRSG